MTLSKSPLFCQLPRNCHLKESIFHGGLSKTSLLTACAAAVNSVDTYSLEHSGVLSSETCHFLGFCPLDGCLSCPKWIIPSHMAAWHRVMPAATSPSEDMILYVIVPAFNSCFLGWPYFIRDAQELLKCHAVNHPIDMPVSGCLASLLQNRFIIDLLPFAIKPHVYLHYQWPW